MSLVIGDITVSLDGYVTGPGADPDHGLGLDADGLHAWALDSDHAVDRGVLERHAAASGAVIMGRHTFDVVDGNWTTERGYGADQDARPPFFVVTSRPPASYRLAGTHDFTFVTDGPAGATWVDRDGVRTARAPVVDIVDATGAGDAFDAGLLAAWLSGADPEAALRAGCAAGAEAVSRRGARPPGRRA